MRPRWHGWQPRYELRLVRGDAESPPILVWSRHRIRALALHCKRLEEQHIDLGQARLVVHDRWTATVADR